MCISMYPGYMRINRTITHSARSLCKATINNNSSTSLRQHVKLSGARLDTSHSQRSNSGKSLGTGRCGWWCPIETWSVEILPVKLLIVHSFFSDCLPRLTHNWRFPRNKIYRNRFLLISPIQQKFVRTSMCNIAKSYGSYLLPEYDVWLTICCARVYDII